MHTDLPETPVAVVAEEQPSTGLRRRLIGAGLIGLAGSLVPRLATRAGASPDTPATTTTAPPKRPTTDDVSLLGFAQSVELAAVELYQMAVAAQSLGDTALAVVTSVQQAHVAYAQSLNALLGRQAPGTVLTDVVDQFAADFSGDEASILSAAFVLEDTAVATHSELIGQLTGVDGAELIASMLIAEARHSAAFADLAGETDLDTLIFTSAQALEPGEG